MGNCIKDRVDPRPTLNEHSHIQKHIRFGVMGEKTPEGEVHVGIKAVVDKRTDKEYTTINGNKILSVMNNNQLVKQETKPKQWKKYKSI